MEIRYKCGIGGCCFLIMNLFLHWNWRRSWRKLSWLAVFAKWTYGMLSAAYYSCLSILFFFLARYWISHCCFRVRRPPFRSACKVVIIPYCTRRSLDDGLSCDADGIAGGKPYQVPRAHPLLLQSTPFLPAAIQVLAHASSFVPRSHPSMWLTSISPTPYDALRSHHQTLIQTWLPRAKQRTMATSRLCSTCFQKALISMCQLRPPLPYTWRHPPLNHDTLAVLRFPSGSIYFCFLAFWVGRGGAVVNILCR